MNTPSDPSKAVPKMSADLQAWHAAFGTNRKPGSHLPPDLLTLRQGVKIDGFAVSLN